MRAYTYTFRQMVLILIYSVPFAAVLGAAAAGGCDKPTFTPVPTGDVGLPDRQCMVGRYRIVTPGQAESHQPPVCAVLCQWDKEPGYHNATGYADAVPVPCSWYGQRVIVERWVNPSTVDPVVVTP